MTRPMVTVGIPFLSCLLAASFLPRAAAVWLAAGLVGGLFAAVLLRGKRRQRLFALLAAGLLGCVCWIAAQDGWAFSQGREGQSILLSGIVEEIEPSGGGRVKYTVRVTASDLEGAPKEFRALLYASAELDCDYYDMITAEGKCLSVSNTPTFDYKRYLRSQGIALAIGANRAVAEPAKLRGPLYYIKRFRGELLRRTDQLLRQPEAGLVKAIVLGDASGLDETADNQLQRGGISHIAVVSGMHVSLVAGVLLLLLRKLRVSARAAALAAGAAAWGFAALTGFGLSSVRACIMLSVLLAATLFRRPADALNSLFLAGILILLANPAAIWSASFQLSFLATLGAVELAAPIGRGLAKALMLRSRLGRGICGLVGMTIGCNLAMLPAVLWLFRGISLVAPAANLAAVPLLPAVMLLSVLMLAFSPFPAAAGFLAATVTFMLKAIMGVVQALTSIPFSYLGLNYSFVFLWLAGAAALVLWAAFGLKQKKTAVRMAALLCAGLAGLLCFQGIHDRGKIRVVPVVSYGGGDVVLLHEGSATLLSFADDRKMAGETEEFLRSRNIRAIENLVLLHPETREPSGLLALSESIPAANLLMNEEDDWFSYAVSAQTASGRPLAKNGVYPLREGVGYDLFRFPEGYCDIYCGADGELVTLQRGGTRLMVTASAELARTAECEILIYAGENFDFSRKIPAEYVILLQEPKPGGEPPGGFSPAYERRVEVTLGPQGGFEVRD